MMRVFIQYLASGWCDVMTINVCCHHIVTNFQWWQESCSMQQHGTGEETNNKRNGFIICKMGEIEDGLRPAGVVSVNVHPLNFRKFVFQFLNFFANWIFLAYKIEVYLINSNLARVCCLETIKPTNSKIEAGWWHQVKRRQVSCHFFFVVIG